MKQKTVVLIVLAVVCGLGASFMTSKLLADRQQQEETVKVLVAKKNLDTGMMIKKPEEAFEEKEILKETAPKNALSKLEEVKGRQLKIPRRAGDTITQDDLFDDKSPGLMSTLPPGHRAVGVRVSSEQIAAGFAAVPHSRIDIACAVRSNIEKENGTRIILQNVLVLASGQATIRDEGGKPMLCDVVTVALTPEDALKLETAKSMGGLTMFLRPFGESTFVKTGLVTRDQVNHSSGKSSATEEEEELKRSKDVVPVDLTIPPSTSQTAVQLSAPNDKFVQRITNGTVLKVIYTRDADGLYESRTEVVEPVPGSTSAPGARTAPTPSTAATPAKR
jgi:pilus assembly protein CpaB